MIRYLFHKLEQLERTYCLVKVLQKTEEFRNGRSCFGGVQGGYQGESRKER